MTLKVVTGEKVGGFGVKSTLGALYGNVVMGVLLSFDYAAILYGAFNIIVFAANTVIVCAANGR